MDIFFFVSSSRKPLYILSPFQKVSENFFIVETSAIDTLHHHHAGTGKSVTQLFITVPMDVLYVITIVNVGVLSAILSTCNASCGQQLYIVYTQTLSLRIQVQRQSYASTSISQKLLFL